MFEKDERIQDIVRGEQIRIILLGKPIHSEKELITTFVKSDSP